MSTISQHIINLKKSSFFTDTLSHFKNYLSTSIATQAISFISIPVLTRLLSPDDYGVYNVFSSYIGLCTVILTLNLYTSVGRYFYEEKDDFNSFFGTSIVLTAIPFGISIIVFLSLRNAISSWFTLPISLIMIMPMIIMIAVIYNLYVGIYQALKESKKIAAITIWRAYLTFGLGIVFVLMLTKNRYIGLIWGQIIVGLAISAYMVHQMRPYIKWKFEKSHVKYIFSYSVPLIPYTLSSIILDQFDRIMINHYDGSASAGLYSFAYNIGMLLSIFSGALYQAWMPNYFDYMNKKDFASLDLNADRMFRIVLAGAAFLIFFGQDIGQFLASRNYHSSLHIVPIIVLGYVFYAIFPIYAWSMGYAIKTFWASFIVLFSGVVNILLNRIFIPQYGYGAAAYTTLASFIIMAFFAWFANRFILHLYTTPLAIILKPLGILLIFFGAITIAQMIIKGAIVLFMIKVLFMAGSAYALFRKYIHAQPFKTSKVEL